MQLELSPNEKRTQLEVSPIGNEPCVRSKRKPSPYTQFAIQDSCLFGPNPWKILALPSNCLSKNSFWATQPLEQILEAEVLLCELGVNCFNLQMLLYVLRFIRSLWLYVDIITNTCVFSLVAIRPAAARRAISGAPPRRTRTGPPPAHSAASRRRRCLNV